ncbi:hypothetical protein GCK72_022088 [Caenorhabditis remanei]|uniref:C2H2-type domain-containing protein n=1 Tax=Caenorhabditis remanei TaxID=31234 RepID=A0A6A5FTC2_CAERE|nr:hypothetical protein GCK72_022088 [Caenorhabditis remanei]KAF1745641.1 hypothetical protein GCK72_022088 [Caenorhabditis remanei]
MDFSICCPKYDFQTKKKSNIVRHLKNVHHLTEAEVNEFDKRIVSNKALETHGTGAFACGYCSHTVATKNGLETHIRRKHPKPLLNPANISLSMSPPSQAPPLKKIHLAKSTKSPILVRHHVAAPESSWHRIREEDTCGQSETAVTMMESSQAIGTVNMKDLSNQKPKK